MSGLKFLKRNKTSFGALSDGSHDGSMGGSPQSLGSSTASALTSSPQPSSAEKSTATPRRIRRFSSQNLGKALKKIVARGSGERAEGSQAGSKSLIRTPSSTPPPPSDSGASSPKSQHSPAIAGVRKVFRRLSSGGSANASPLQSPRGDVQVALMPSPPTSPLNSARRSVEDESIVVQGFDNFDTHAILSPRSADNKASTVLREYSTASDIEFVPNEDLVYNQFNGDASGSRASGQRRLAMRGRSISYEEVVSDIGCIGTMNASVSAIGIMEDMFGYLDSFMGVSAEDSRDAEGDEEDIDSLNVFETPNCAAAYASIKAAPTSELASAAEGMKEPGATLRQAATDTLSGGNVENAFAICPADTFKLRVGPNYKWNKQKAPSPPALYDIASIDIFTSDNYVRNAGARMKFPDEWIRINTHHPLIPPLFCVGVHVPTKSQPIFGASSDGPGYIMLFTFRMTEETSAQLADMRTASPAVKLFAKYCIQAPELDDDPKSPWKGRFKFIASVHNMKEFNLPSMAESYNAKPMLISSSGSLSRGPHHIEMSVNAYQFGSVAVNAFVGMVPRIPKGTASFGFCIESRKDAEMPETVLGCGTIVKPDLPNMPAISP